MSQLASQTHVTASPARLWNWDSLRWLATFDIVAFHTTGDHALFGWGLPTYLLMTCALAARPGGRARDELTRRARRLLVPWLWGFLLYGVTRSWEAGVAGHALLGWFAPEQWLYGPRVHLWFLPFACAVGVGMAALAPWVRRLRPTFAVVAVACTAVPLGWLSGHAPATWPFAQWAFSVPALALGMALALRVFDGRRGPLVAGLAVSLALAWFVPPTAPTLRRFLGAGSVLLVALELPQRRWPQLERYTPALLGIYVLHPWIFRQWVHDGLWRVGLGDQGWARAGFTFVLSGLASLAVRWAWRRLRQGRSMAPEVPPEVPPSAPMAS